MKNVYETPTIRIALVEKNDVLRTSLTYEPEGTGDVIFWNK